MKEGKPVTFIPVTFCFDLDTLSLIDKDIPCNFPDYLRKARIGENWRLPLPVVEGLREYQKTHPLISILTIDSIRQGGYAIYTVYLADY